MDRVILHCDCNAFYASVETLLRPELGRVPMAVCGDPESRHGIILAKGGPKIRRPPPRRSGRQRQMPRPHPRAAHRGVRQILPAGQRDYQLHRPGRAVRHRRVGST
ncbi:MAG: hypothetical protein ACLVL7_07855 [Anaerotruncus massiliensis (ex Togo et al. 2019)]